MKNHASMCWMSGSIGGLQITWNDLMELPIPDRQALVEAVEDHRKQEQELLKVLHGLKQK